MPSPTSLPTPPVAAVAEASHRFRPELRTAPVDAAPADSLAALSSVLEAIGDLATDDHAAGMARVAERLQALVPWRTFAVLLLDDAGRELRFQHAIGLPDEMVARWRFGLGQGLIGRALESGSQCSTQPCDTDFAASGPQPASALEAGMLLAGLRAEIAVPLRGRDRLLGVLDLGHHAEDAFSAEHVRLVEIVAHHLGRTLESAAAHAQSQRLARNLGLLQEAARELTSILDRQALLERIADIVARLVDYQLFSVMVWSEERTQLESIFFRRGAECSTEKLVLRLGEGLCGTSAAQRQPVRVGNVRLDSRYVDCGDGQVRSELVLPLTFEGRLLGVLDLESFALDAFTAEHEQILQTLASSIAIALENSNLYERLRDDEQRLARDLSTAREVQRFLLPRRSPWVPGLQVGVANAPARHLGGDVYDFYSYGEQRTAIAIGDVAGKGTAAALYGSLTIGLLRGGYASINRCEPACVMAYLNGELRQLDVDRRFLAFGFVVYDASSHQLQMANAGLPYPWLLRHGRAQELDLSGVPLGAMAQAKREQRTIDLEPGDVVVLTTDGIDEARDAHDTPFGSQSVRTVLERWSDATAQQIADALIQATDRHLGERMATDDRTVVVLKVTS